MPGPYEGMTDREADDRMRGAIGSLVCEALDDARRMTHEDLQDRDIFEWSQYVSGLIAVVIENRRRAAP